METPAHGVDIVPPDVVPASPRVFHHSHSQVNRLSLDPNVATLVASPVNRGPKASRKGANIPTRNGAGTPSGPGSRRYRKRNSILVGSFQDVDSKLPAIPPGVAPPPERWEMHRFFMYFMDRGLEQRYRTTFDKTRVASMGWSLVPYLCLIVVFGVWTLHHAVDIGQSDFFKPVFLVSSAAVLSLVAMLAVWLLPLSDLVTQVTLILIGMGAGVCISVSGATHRHEQDFDVQWAAFGVLLSNMIWILVSPVLWYASCVALAVCSSVCTWVLLYSLQHEHSDHLDIGLLATMVTLGCAMLIFARREVEMYRRRAHIGQVRRIWEKFLHSKDRTELLQRNDELKTTMFSYMLQALAGPRAKTSRQYLMESPSETVISTLLRLHHEHKDALGAETVREVENAVKLVAEGGSGFFTPRLQNSGEPLDETGRWVSNLVNGGLSKQVRDNSTSQVSPRLNEQQQHELRERAAEQLVREISRADDGSEGEDVSEHSRTVSRSMSRYNKRQASISRATDEPTSDDPLASLGSGNEWAVIFAEGSPDSHFLVRDQPEQRLPRVTQVLGSRFERVVSHIDRSLEDWNMDLLQVHNVSHRCSLRALGYVLWQRYGFMEKFNIEPRRLHNFLATIEGGYRDVPYHNSVHGADVTRTVHYFLWVTGIRHYLSDLECLAVLLAALIHDVDHPGRNNNFLIQTGHPWSVLYNDESPLESHHTAFGWSALLHDRNNFLAHLPRDQYVALRRMVVALVKATDLKHHFSFVGEMSQALKVKATLDSKDPKTRMDLMKLMLKCADVGHTSKRFSLHCRWTAGVVTEFYAQGVEEGKFGMVVSPFMDPSADNLPKSQQSFIEVLVHPLYSILAKIADPEGKYPLSAPPDRVIAQQITASPPSTDEGKSAVPGRTVALVNGLPPVLPQGAAMPLSEGAHEMDAIPPVPASPPSKRGDAVLELAGDGASTTVEYSVFDRLRCMHEMSGNWRFWADLVCQQNASEPSDDDGESKQEAKKPTSSFGLSDLQDLVEQLAAQEKMVVPSAVSPFTSTRRISSQLPLGLPVSQDDSPAAEKSVDDVPDDKDSNAEGVVSKDVVITISDEEIASSDDEEEDQAAS